MIALFQTIKSIMIRLARNPLRNLLSITSIALGVTTVALALNVSFRFQEQMRAAELRGAMFVTVANVERKSENEFRWEGRPVFTAEDAEMLRRDYPSIVKISPVSRIMMASIQVGEELYRPRSVMGVGGDYPAIVGLELAAGSFFTLQDLAAGNKVAVISEEAARILFGGAAEAVGRTFLNLEAPAMTMNITGQQGGPPAVPGGAARTSTRQAVTQSQPGTKTAFQVVGVYAAVPALKREAFGIPDFLVPYTSGRRPAGTVDTFCCLVAGDDFEAARANIEQSLRGRHGDEAKIEIWQGDPFHPFGLAANLRRTQVAVTMFFGAFALIALLVSSFGVFGMMTVSTLERTREVGLSRALGATRLRVSGNFLLEALVLSAAGAFMGLGLAAVLNGQVIKAVQPLLTNGGSPADAALIPANLGLPAALCAAAVTALAGVLFGLFPAFSTARVEPVESLREG